ncbi:N-acetylglucosamine-6-phosphate deacetylase [Sporosarcina luteola]|uniref:N-acetylglucosamine-6-phosphate deacetylase n=2 Tax=Sporosarcina luteola TaxID=582850 RepID=A0A511Z4N2_9BACL|nr:N-acetylglucosamine-6-phosphate deacetylase [Sporosarcina luteola]
MMKPIWLLNATIVLERSILENGFLHLKEGKVCSFGHMADCPPIPDRDLQLDCQSKRIIPGMIDIHVHGAGGFDVMDASVEALDGMAKKLAQEGTTSFLATTMTNPANRIGEAMSAIKMYRERIKQGVPEMIGIHLEGPFIHPVQKGAQPEQHILQPDIELFNEWQRLSGGAIKIVTFAPETGDRSFVERLVQEGVIASIGHSNATYAETLENVRSGVTHATHLFNGMRGLHHREPGVVGAALLADEVYVEVIPDGHHFHPDLLKLILRQKGVERTLVITDGIRAKGMPDGVYDLGGNNVTVRDGKCTLEKGASLAGSILTMNEARKNIAKWGGLSLLEQTYITSLNQAKRLGIDSRKGSIAVGKDADVVLLDETDHIEMTICNGTIAYASANSNFKRLCDLM